LCNDGRSGVLSGTRGGGGGRGEFTLNDGVTGHFVYGPGALKIVRRQVFWNGRLLDSAESLAHLLFNIRRLDWRIANVVD
jgi:hypothetical protein